MTIRRTVCCVALCTWLATPALAGETVPVRAAADCMEGPLAQFGRYIGNWTIEDSVRNKDTGEWEAGSGAQWNFVCLGGMAIQDFWLPANGKVGTNLRTWNAETGSWDIAWTITGMPGFAHIQARQDADGNLVMRYVSPQPQPDRRITFFPPGDRGWNWKLEISRDGDDQWIEVYRITATPTPD